MGAKPLVDSQFSLGGNNGAKISIELYRYERADTGDYWDSNWLDSTIDVAVERFSVRTRAALRAEDFPNFLSELTPLVANLKGIAKFETTERQLSILVEMNPRGTCKVSGRVTDHINCTLEYAFESDQTFLQQTLTDLQTIVDEFPVLNPEAR